MQNQKNGRLNIGQVYNDNREGNHRKDAQSLESKIRRSGDERNFEWMASEL